MRRIPAFSFDIQQQTRFPPLRRAAPRPRAAPRVSPGPPLVAARARMNLLARIDRALASYLDVSALKEELSRIRAGISEERETLAKSALLETVVDTLPLAIL